MGGTGLEPVTPSLSSDRWRYVRFRPIRPSGVEPACHAAFGHSGENDSKRRNALCRTFRHCTGTATVLTTENTALDSRLELRERQALAGVKPARTRFPVAVRRLLLIVYVRCCGASPIWLSGCFDCSQLVDEVSVPVTWISVGRRFAKPGNACREARAAPRTPWELDRDLQCGRGGRVGGLELAQCLLERRCDRLALRGGDHPANDPSDE